MEENVNIQKDIREHCIWKTENYIQMFESMKNDTETIKIGDGIEVEIPRLDTLMSDYMNLMDGLEKTEEVCEVLDKCQPIHSAINLVCKKRLEAVERCLKMLHDLYIILTDESKSHDDISISFSTVFVNLSNELPNLLL